MTRLMKNAFAFSVFLLVSAMIFAENGLSFENKVSSGILKIESKKEKDETGDEETKTTTEFAGIENKTTVDYSNSKLDIGIEAIFWTRKGEYTNKDGDKKDFLGIGYVSDDDNASGGFKLNDWYIEFRPFEIVGFGFHRALKTQGSYLPIWDDYINEGNFGSDFGAIIRPIEGLRIGGGIDFLSTLGVEDSTDGTPDQFVSNVGIDYTSDVFSVGVAIRNFFTEDRTFGFYGSFSGLDNFEFMGGFAIDSVNGVSGPFGHEVSGDILSASVTFDRDEFFIAAELVTNFGDDDTKGGESVFDFYTAGSLTYAITKAFSATAEVKFVSDHKVPDGIDETNAFELHPYVNFITGHHNFEAGIDFSFEKDHSIVEFPVSWTYTY